MGLIAAPVQRLVFRDQIHVDGTETVENALSSLQPALAQRVADDELLTLSLFNWRRNLFLYYECPGEAVPPSSRMGPVEAALSAWPGEATPRLWVPMMDIFHFNSPQSIEHWRRDTPPQQRTARVIYLRPEMVSSYISTTIQMQEKHQRPATDTVRSRFTKTCSSSTWKNPGRLKPRAKKANSKPPTRPPPGKL